MHIYHCVKGTQIHTPWKSCMKHHKRDSKKPSMRFTNMSYEPKVFRMRFSIVRQYFFFATRTCNWFLGMKLVHRTKNCIKLNEFRFAKLEKLMNIFVKIHSYIPHSQFEKVILHMKCYMKQGSNICF